MIDDMAARASVFPMEIGQFPTDQQTCRRSRAVTPSENSIGRARLSGKERLLDRISKPIGALWCWSGR